MGLNKFILWIKLARYLIRAYKILFSLKTRQAKKLCKKNIFEFNYTKYTQDSIGFWIILAVSFNNWTIERFNNYLQDKLSLYKFFTFNLLKWKHL